LRASRATRSSWIVFPEHRVRRASLLLVLALAASARADEEPAAHRETMTASSDPRTQLADQITAESETVATALATVDSKLGAADQIRLRRVRAAMRILNVPTPPGATLADRFAAARRRAAARLLLARDASERGLLAEEQQHLHAAAARTAEDRDKVAAIHIPEQLARPCKGKITRHFGTYEHERSHVLLSRRGLDFEVDDHAAAFAPADGVVRYAGPIRGLDHGVVLDHGDYFTVVAKLGELAIPVGTHVAQGDHLGRAQRHRIYFEVRVKLGPGGLPIDPEPLLQKP
jgi:murein DD-endopeptidase MepM/ murein hydrolase activator NlpD